MASARPAWGATIPTIRTLPRASSDTTTASSATTSSSPTSTASTPALPWTSARRTSHPQHRFLDLHQRRRRRRFQLDRRSICRHQGRRNSQQPGAPNLDARRGDAQRRPQLRKRAPEYFRERGLAGNLHLSTLGRERHRQGRRLARNRPRHGRFCPRAQSGPRADERR